MVEDYVKQLRYPIDEKDQRFVKRKARGETFEHIPQEITRYAIEYFIQAINAYREDIDSSKLCYTILIYGEKAYIDFSPENMIHLYGLPDPRDIQKIPSLQGLHVGEQTLQLNLKKQGDRWLEYLGTVFKVCGEEILRRNTERPPYEETLNWYKICSKAFAMLNLGILSKVYDREAPLETQLFGTSKPQNKSKSKDFYLIKKVITEKETGFIHMQLIPVINGKGEIEYLIPQSVFYSKESRPQNYRDKFGREVKYFPYPVPTIEQKKEPIPSKRR